MNRSILIVICDFLLVSLLAFSSFDKLNEEPPERKSDALPGKKEIGGKQDMMAALKLALADEKQSREKLTSELAKAREAVQAKQALMEQRDSAVQQTSAALQKAEAQTHELAEQRSTLQQQ